MKKVFILSALVFFLFQGNMKAQYNLVWSEEFNGTELNSAVWNVEENIGVWNTEANKELQHYRAENVSVGDDGNGNNCLILTAKKESYNGYAFTSGKVETKGKFSVKYGKIEARIKMPDLEDGLWPAFWLLGYGETGWPACGEIDILEMGHADGIAQNAANRYHSGALHWDNNGQYAGYGTGEVAASNLNEDFHTYTVEWTPSEIKMYLDGNSTSPYFSMNITGDDASEFREFSDYILLNLAVGGSFPGILDPNNITAPMPAKMYVDYVKVYQKDEEGEIDETPIQYGNFGVYADKTTKMALKTGYDETISTTNLTSFSGGSQYGDNAINYLVTTNDAVNLKVESNATRNMSRFNTNGGLEFYIKTSVLQDITVSVKDINGNASSFVLNSGFEYNPERNNTWQKVVIPFGEMTGSADFNAIKSMCEFSFTGTGNAELSVDEIIWTERATSLDYYGIYTENAGVSTRFLIDDVTGHIYIWENSMSPLEGAPSYEGDDVLAFSSNPLAAWYGFGLHDDNGVDLSHFADGYLFLSAKTTSSEEFWIGMAGANDTEAKITFNSVSDPYGFMRDGNWHNLVIPVSDLTDKGLDLTNCGTLFMAGGLSISDIAFDEIILSKTNSIPENTNINPNGNSGTGNADNVQVISSDNFGVYSENTNISDHFLIDDENGHIYIWSNLSATTITPYEGEAVLSFASGAAGWFGFGLFSDKAHDLSHFANGYLHVTMKTTATTSFWLGVGGSGEGKITFNGTNDPYGFVRDGEWHTIVIPVADLITAGLSIDVVGNLFMAGGDVAVSNIAFDDIVYSTSQTLPENPNINTTGGDNPYEITSDIYGIFTENPNIENKFSTDDDNGNIFIWENTLTANANAAVYEGEGVLDFASTGKGWYGYGINSANPLDLTHFADGYLHFVMKTSSATDNFTVGIEGAAGSKAEVYFQEGNDPYGFMRDGEWHQISVALSDFSSLDLSASGNIFYVVGAANTSIAIDDVVLSKSATPVANPNVGATGINDYTQNSIRVYPNPANDILHIDGLKENTEISIFGLTGKKYINKTLNAKSIDVSALPVGIYILEVKNENEISRIKILKK